MPARYPATPSNREFSVDRIPRVVLAAILGTVAVFYLWYGLPGQEPPLNDFGSFWAAGRAAIQGQNPYDVYPETFRIPGTVIVHPNLNPPASLLLFAPLSLIDPHLVMKMIWWSGLVVFLTIVGVACRSGDTDEILVKASWALALPAFWDSLRLGQVYLLLFALAAGAWLLLRRRPAAAGILIGVFIAIKPNFLFWPVVLFLTGRRKAALCSGIAFLVLGLLPLAVFGPQIYSQWFDVLLSETGHRTGAFPNASMLSIGYRAGSPALGLLLVALVLVWAAKRTLLEKVSLTEASAIGIGLGIVVSPVAWFHYLLFLLPAILTRRWSPAIWVGAVIMVLPVVPAHVIFDTLPKSFPVFAEPIRATIGSLFSWAALVLLATLGRDSNRSGAASPADNA